MLLCSVNTFAQDVIVKKDGSTIVCRVVEVKSTEIVYKLWSDLNGSNYVMDRSLASSINYENGKKETLAEITENLYQPNNQSDGYRQMNDKALMNIDYADSKPFKKAKTIKNIGWIGGGLLFVGGGFMALSGFDNWEISNDALFAAGISCMAVGLIGGTVCIISANNIKKKAQKILQYSIYQQEFKFKNGSTLTPSIDILRDQAHNTQTLGLGLQYNF